jgi:hypothetical protein
MWFNKKASPEPEPEVVKEPGTEVVVDYVHRVFTGGLPFTLDALPRTGVHEHVLLVTKEEAEQVENHVVLQVRHKDDHIPVVPIYLISRRTEDGSEGRAFWTYRPTSNTLSHVDNTRRADWLKLLVDYLNGQLVPQNWRCMSGELVDRYAADEAEEKGDNHRLSKHTSVSMRYFREDRWRFDFPARPWEAGVHKVDGFLLKLDGYD